MRRLGLIGILALLVLATLAPATVAARPAAAYRAGASTGHPGGGITVSARVLHATRGTDFSATAVVHLSTGDVSVNLKRAGRSFQAGARVPVPADAAVGPVTIDVRLAQPVPLRTVLAAATAAVRPVGALARAEVLPAPVRAASRAMVVRPPRP